MFCQCLKGEHSFSRTAERHSRFYHPIAENANTADTPFAKPFPMRQHFWDIHLEWDLLYQRLQRAGKFHRIGLALQVIPAKLLFAHAPSELSVQVAEIVQREVSNQDVAQLTLVGERFEPVQLNGRLLRCVGLQEMLSLINANRFHLEKVEGIRDRITHFEPFCRVGALFRPFASKRQIQDAIPYRNMSAELVEHLAVKV